VEEDKTRWIQGIIPIEKPSRFSILERIHVNMFLFGRGEVLPHTNPNIFFRTTVTLRHSRIIENISLTV
jgi:hypothetical protein